MAMAIKQEREYGGLFSENWHSKTVSVGQRRSSWAASVAIWGEAGYEVGWGEVGWGEEGCDDVKWSAPCGVDRGEGTYCLVGNGDLTLTGEGTVTYDNGADGIEAASSIVLCGISLTASQERDVYPPASSITQEDSGWWTY